MYDDAIEVLDKRFQRYAIPNAHIDVLYRGMRWAEGPVYFPAGKYLLFSDIPNDRVMRFDETDDSVSVFDSKCGNHNGHTIDREGRLVSCEHRGRRISRIELDGSTRTLVDTVDGQRLNSPNDVVIKSDGSVWFTDPTYGIDGDYEGDRAQSEIGGSHVYRYDSASGSTTAVATDFAKPNGLAFSADESLLYISDTGASHEEDGPKHIRVFNVSPDGALSGGEVFAESTNGMFDGFRIDVDGNVWTSAGDGVHCYTSDGELIGKILTDEVVANVEFGGPKRNRLYICATTTLQAMYVNTRAAPRGIG